MRFDGADAARPAPGVLEALRDADAIVICPANPILSIAPILAVPGIRETVAAHPRVVGISNLIAGAAVRGPADRMLADLGIEASCVGVARGLPRPVRRVRDRRPGCAHAPSEVEALGVRAVVTDTLMKDRQVARHSLRPRRDARRGRLRARRALVHRGPTIDPHVPSRTGAVRGPRRARPGCVRRAGAAPLTSVAWVSSTHPRRRERLATGMGDRWRRDLAGDGVRRTRIDELVDASHRKIVDAPALVLGCLTWDGLDRYPDETRQRAEWGMALLSLGAAVENLMLATADAGYASCWVAAPIFCPEEARDALALPATWLPTP